MLTEAALVAVSTAGSMRTCPRAPGNQIAIVAVARKLAVLLWHLHQREQDYSSRSASPCLHRGRLHETRAADAHCR
jgi:hypothetical protein